MKKGFILVATMLTACISLTGCHMKHEWQEATCTEPRTCTIGGETEGESLGHTWTEATCTAPKTCSVCGETEGETLDHDWIEATCTTPKTCSVCGETEGETLDHDWIEATCTAPKTCSVCGKTEGGTAEHNLNSTGKCSVCNEQIGIQLNSSNYEKYLKLTARYKQNHYCDNSYNDCYDYKVEPMENVTFCNVTISIVYIGGLRTDYDKIATISVNSSGYGQLHQKNKSFVRVESVSGYVIE